MGHVILKINWQIVLRIKSSPEDVVSFTFSCDWIYFSFPYTHTHTYIYIYWSTVYIYIYICLCVCVFVCVRAHVYIVIHRQTVSLYHNSSVWLDTPIQAGIHDRWTDIIS